MTATRNCTGVAAALALVAVACSGRSEPRPPPPSEPPARAAPPLALWVTIDTLRPDHLSSYGHVRPTSPNLDRLAAAGVRFERAIAQGPWTFSSVPSLMTSRSPQSHTELMVGDHPEAIVSEGSTTVAQALRDAGYRTALVTGHGALGALDGLCDGMDECHVAYENAERVTDRALEVLARRPGRPMFLWVYYIDPHVPYEAPDEHTLRWVGDGRLSTGLRAPVGDHPFLGRRALPLAAVRDGREDLDFYVAAYDGQIAYTDHHVGRLLAAAPHALAMVFADHGESLTEHDLYLSHSVQLYDTLLRIPWLVGWPGEVRPGQVVDADVMALDVAPTLLGLLRVDRPSSWEGRDLSACLRGRARCEPRDAFALLRTAQGPLVALRRWPDKVICAADGTGCRMFDVRADPGETRDVCASRAERCAALGRRAAAWHASRPPPVLPARVRELPGETLEALRALGYVER